VNRRPAWSALAIEGNFSTVTFDVHLEDRGVVDQTIDGSQRHCLVREDTPPFAKWLIGRDQQRASFVAGGDQLEQHTGFRLILAHICDVVEDQEVIAIEFGDRGLQRQLAPRDLQPLHQISGAREENAPTVLDESQADRRAEMGPAAARRTSVIMPGVWDLRLRSSTRSIRDAERQSSLSPASGLGVRRILLSDNLTPR